MIHRDFYGPLIEFGKMKENNIKKISQVPINYTVLSDYCAIGGNFFQAIQNEPAEIVSTDEKIRVKLRKLASHGIFKESNSKLVVLERNYDKLIHLIIPWHYESMIHFHDIKIINDGDDDYVYNDIRCKRFDEAIEYISKNIKDIDKKNIDKNDSNLIAEHILKKKLYKKHHETLCGLSDIVKYNKFYIRSEEEQKIITLCKKDSLKLISDIGTKMKNAIINTDKDEKINDQIFEINPEIMSIAINMTDKNIQNVQNPLVMQYLPKIRKIMDSYNGSSDVIYIYVKDFVCYEEIIEVENFNKFSDTKFILLSESCKNYWYYHYTSKNNSNDVIEHFDIYNDANKKINEEMYPELTDNLHLLKNSFVNSNDFDPTIIQNLINKINNDIAIEFKKLDSFVIENTDNATSLILKNKKSRCLMKLRGFALELQKYTNKQKKYNNQKLKKEQEKDEEEKEKTLSQTQIQDKEQLENQTNYIKQREKEINDLYQNISNMNKIFVDLNVIIEAQDVILNNINQNILSSKDSIIKGTSDIKKSVDYVKKSNDFNIKLAIGGTFVALAGFLKLTK